jgi:hypothetical protein
MLIRDTRLPRPAVGLRKRNFGKSTLFAIVLLTAAILVACGKSNSSGGGSGSAGPPAQIAATGGSGQSASVGTAFPAPLAATVEDSKNNVVSGAAVTFTAPSSGASGTFANGQITETDTTDSNGVATSSTFTANSNVSLSSRYNVAASVTGVLSTVNFSLENLIPASVTATQGFAQGTLINTAFGQTLEVTVSAQGGAQNGVSVIFTAPSSGASGTFAGATNTVTVSTDANGVATAPAFTANGTTGVYQVTALASDSPTPVTFDLINVSSTSSPFAAGNYVFSLSGTDANASDYSVAGVFTVDANGLIAPSGAYQSFSDLSYTASYLPVLGGGALVRASDGNVRIILDTGNTNIGVGGNGEEVFDVAPVSGSHALLTEFDHWASGSGELNLQTLPTATDSPCATMPCNYAFLISSSGPGDEPFAMGGIFTVASANTISGGIFDANDNNGGTHYQGDAITSSSFKDINSLGYVQFTLNLTAVSPPEIVLDGYVVDSSHIRLVRSSGYDVIAGGIALAQTGTNLAGVCTSGVSYVIGMKGNDRSGNDNDGILQVAGLFTMPNSNAGSALGGFINYNDLPGTPPQQPLAITAGVCTPDTTFAGRVSISGVTIQSSSVTPNLQLYVTGDSDGDVLALTLDATDTVAGHGYQQSAGPFTAGDFSGSYAVDATGVSPVTSSVSVEEVFGAVGAVTANGSGAISGSGSVDLNWLGNPGPTAGLSVTSGSYAVGSNGVFTGAMTGLDVLGSSTSDAFSYYLVDNAGANGSSSRVIAIETDTNQLSLDFLEQQ